MEPRTVGALAVPLERDFLALESAGHSIAHGGRFADNIFQLGHDLFAGRAEKFAAFAVRIRDPSFMQYENRIAGELDHGRGRDAPALVQTAPLEEHKLLAADGGILHLEPHGQGYAA